MLNRRKIENFRITYNGFFLKISKNVIFSENCLSFDSMSEDFLLEQKKVKNTKISPGIRKKNVTGVNFDVFTVFLGEHVKSLRQQCS